MRANETEWKKSEREMTGMIWYGEVGKDEVVKPPNNCNMLCSTSVYLPMLKMKYMYNILW